MVGSKIVIHEGKCTIDGGVLSPTEFHTIYRVWCGEGEWYDFHTGRWSGVLTIGCLLACDKLAKRLLEINGLRNAIVATYAMINLNRTKSQPDEKGDDDGDKYYRY